jgi:hypothetical protein
MTEPITPETVQHLAVTVSEPDNNGWCRVIRPDGYWWTHKRDEVRKMGLTIPEPTVSCTIGDIEFTLTGEQVRALSDYRAVAVPGPLRYAARRWVDAREDR